MKVFSMNMDIWRSVQMRIASVLLYVSVVVSAGQLHHIEKRSNICELPPYPKYGEYEVAGYPLAGPGDELEYVFLNVTCSSGKGVIGNNVAICIKGEWSREMPQCVSFCKLPTQSGVEYSCWSYGENNYRPCGDYEPLGSTVKAKCLEGFYSPEPLPLMKCIDGVWDSLAVCNIECGIISSSAKSLPWHVIIYKKETYEFKMLCAGSIISTTIVLSAAHCFWDSLSNRIKSKQGYAAIVGKLTQGWDVNEQKYLVADVQIPEYFLGQQTNYQNDIALLKLTEPIQYSIHIRPVCIDFDPYFQRNQLRGYSLGKVSLWSELNIHAKIIVKELPHIPMDECIRESPTAFRELITRDKMCAGFKNDSYNCVGSSGAGLAFPETSSGRVRYYLRGIISVSFRPSFTSTLCNNVSIALTLISAHEQFILSMMTP